MAQIKPARLYARIASEALDKIEVSSMESPQFAKRFNIVFPVIQVIRLYPLPEWPRL